MLPPVQKALSPTAVNTTATILRPLSSLVDCIEMQVLEKGPADEDVAGLTAFRLHAVAVLRIEANPNVAFSSFRLVRVEHVVQRERGDFFPSQSGLKTESENHLVVRVQGRCQQCLDF